MKKQTKQQQTFERVALALVHAGELPTASRFAEWAGLPAIPKTNGDGKLTKKNAWREVAIAVSAAFTMPGTIEAEAWNALVETSLQSIAVMAESLPSDKAEIARLAGFIDATAPKHRAS